MINAMTLILIFHFFSFLGGDVPRRPSYGVYNISQIKRFDRVCIYVEDFNARNKLLNFLKQGHRYQKIRKAFSKFYCRHH